MERFIKFTFNGKEGALSAPGISPDVTSYHVIHPANRLRHWYTGTFNNMLQGWTFYSAPNETWGPGFEEFLRDLISRESQK